MADTEDGALTAIELTRAKLESFLSNNPSSSLEEMELEDGHSVVIKTPWGDTSLALDLGPEPKTDVIAALNEVILPPRFSAIWHVDKKELEVIWTAFKLPSAHLEIYGREFEFHFKGNKYKAKFGASSERLILIGECFVPLSTTETNFRNLPSFNTYAELSETPHKSLAGLDRPCSFWLSGFDWDEEKVVEIINNLNFFLSYYDDRSPTVLIHQPAPDQTETIRRNRYVRGSFPTKIVSDGLDDKLMSFWSFASSGNPMMRFILYFRIIEYAAFHHMEHATKLEIERLLRSPSLHDDRAEALERITAAFNATKLDETQKFKAVVRKCVAPNLLWRDVKANQSFFSKDTKFDGGFTVKAFVGAQDNEASFCGRGLDGFCDAVRKIRNAVSHGKDQETAGVITPTAANFRLFNPWVHLISAAAGEVVLYKDIT